MLEVTATDLPRLLACNGSRKMVEFTPTVGVDDTVRREGDAAHWLIEQSVKHQVDGGSFLHMQAPNGIFITDDMVDHTSDFIQRAQAGGFVEYETNHRGSGWAVNGRADHAQCDGLTLYINDFKYGYSIVEPDLNWTLISHACGFTLRNPGLFFQRVVFTIYQPRAYHRNGQIRSWEISTGEFDRLWKEMAHRLSTPDDMLHTGEHCYKCPAYTTCHAARKAEMNSIEASEIAFTDNISNERLSVLLDMVGRAQDVIKQAGKAYEELALHRLYNKEIIPNYSLERVIGNREWKAAATPEVLQLMTGKDLSKKKQLVSPKQAEKMGVPPEAVKVWTTRDEKGVKLVRVDVCEQAAEMFNQPKGK